MVLLKNETGLLPLSKEKKIALIGPLANDSDTPIGNWRAKGESNSAVSVLDGMKKYFVASNGKKSTLVVLLVAMACV